MAELKMTPEEIRAHARATLKRMEQEAKQWEETENRRIKAELKKEGRREQSQVEEDRLINPLAAAGQLRLTSPVGNLSQNAGNVGGAFQGGTFSFSSLTPFTTFRLAGFTSTGAGTEFAIDNLTVTFTPQQQPVPEPTTMLLLGTGLAGLGGMIKRRRQGK